MMRSRAMKPAFPLYRFLLFQCTGRCRSGVKRRCGWLAALLLGHAAGAGAQVSDLVVFGDSNTDAGNAEIIATAAGAASPTPAGFGYFNGRFSNGPTLADRLREVLLSGNTTASLAGGLNFSVGGASAATDRGRARPAGRACARGPPARRPRGLSRRRGVARRSSLRRCTAGTDRDVRGGEYS